LLILAARRVPGPPRGRRLLLLAIYGVFSLATLASFVNSGFFTMFGAPLNADMLLLAAPMAGYASKVITVDDPMLRLAVIGLVRSPLVGLGLWRGARGSLVRDERSWRPGAWAAAALVTLSAIGLGLTPVTRYRETSLRRLSLLSMMFPSRA